MRRLWDATMLREMICPRRFQLSVLEGWRSARPGPAGTLVESGNDDLKFGTLLHSALERWDALLPLDSDLVEAWPMRREAALLETMRWTLVESQGWESQSNTKNRHTLLRAVVWYCLDQLKQPLRPVGREDGRPFLETQLRMPLPITDDATGQPFELVANIDGIKQWGGEVFAHERKSTGSYLGRGYWAKYGLGPQPDTYDLVAARVWPEPVTGVVLEAVQTGVQFARWERRMLPRSPAKRTEWLDEVCRTIQEAVRYEAEFGDRPWPMRRSACNLDGGCPFRRVCSLAPSVRPAALRADYVRRPHDPLHPGGRDVKGTGNAEGSRLPARQDQAD